MWIDWQRQMCIANMQCEQMVGIHFQLYLANVFSLFTFGPPFNIGAETSCTFIVAFENYMYFICFALFQSRLHVFKYHGIQLQSDTSELFLECKGGGGRASLCISMGSRLGMGQVLQLGSFSKKAKGYDEIVVSAVGWLFSPKGVHPPSPPFNRHNFHPFFSFAMESYLNETDFTLCLS